jgi:hypothetical protein
MYNASARKPLLSAGSAYPGLAWGREGCDAMVGLLTECSTRGPEAEWHMKASVSSTWLNNFTIQVKIVERGIFLLHGRKVILALDNTSLPASRISATLYLGIDHLCL